jgi:hypothetical protein
MKDWAAGPTSAVIVVGVSVVDIRVVGMRMGQFLMAVGM